MEMDEQPRVGLVPMFSNHYSAIERAATDPDSLLPVCPGKYKYPVNR